MKIIFLDFDGVLNSERYFRSYGAEGLALNSENLCFLKEIVVATGAKIVLSTSWREHWEKDDSKCSAMGVEMNEIFKKYEMEIFDKTPFSCISREQDIEDWLMAHPDTQAFVVLDDRFLDSPIIRGHFVKTDPYIYGLDEAEKDAAIEILMQ